MRFPISPINISHCTKMLMSPSITQENLLQDRWLLEDLKEPALDKHRRELWAVYAVHPRETKKIAVSECKKSKNDPSTV